MEMGWVGRWIFKLRGKGEQTALLLMETIISSVLVKITIPDFIFKQSHKPSGYLLYFFDNRLTSTIREYVFNTHAIIPNL